MAVSNFSQVLGQPVTLTATLSPSAAGGKVTFYDGVTILGTRAVAGGQAALTTSLLPAGVPNLRAYYGGGGTYSASSSAVARMSVIASAANSFQAR